MADDSLYFDYAATTPLAEAVRFAMAPYLNATFGNPSSVHQFGQVALRGVDSARAQLAAFFSCDPDEVLFTSSATEANNLVLQGILAPGDHLVTTRLEHPSVLAVCRHLESRGSTVTYVAPDRQGVVDPVAIASAVTDQTKLVSVMYVNNELGTIQPVAQVSALLKEQTASRSARGLPPVLLHTDAVQAACYLPLNVRQLGVDFLSLTSHKLYGPKGVGALYHRRGLPLHPQQFGGPQEYGLRPGTVNVAGVVGLGAAISLLTPERQEAEAKRLLVLRTMLLNEVLPTIPGVILNGSRSGSVAAIANCLFPSIAGQDLLILLDQQGMAVSTGSACAAGSPQPSHVLQALGLAAAEAQSSIRISFGRGTTPAAVRRLGESLRRCVYQLRTAPHQSGTR